MMVIKKVKKNWLVLFVLPFGLLAPFVFSLAQTCPLSTTVSGTTVTFSGELTDTGGDSVNYVWFEYGKTSALSLKTAEQAWTQVGMYCITVSGLDSSTTYFYRAGARNTAGVSYGETKSFTTTTPQAGTDFSVSKTVRNLSQGTSFAESVAANPTDVIVVAITVRAGLNSVSNVTVTDNLPSGLNFQGDLRVDSVLRSGSITSGLFLGNLAAGQSSTITFLANVAQAQSFAFGETRLTNRAVVTAGSASFSDTAEIVVTRAQVAGAATTIPTGFTDNILLDSFLIPLVLALAGVWLFKSRILKFEEWVDVRKKQYREYKSDKTLKQKIAKIRTDEIIKKVV
ncbi:MAG: FG-GAP repeat-calx-beta protein [Parcubacteria group bacterium Gr01-1014_30]|nr:MAG: FG-GAP repeat-calx-beta protein [Parcubacteria group bacterium Gr01-1014_30]